MDIKLTRRNFLRVSGVSATLALAACAAAPAAPAASTDAEPMAEKIEIEFMNWWGSHREELMDEVIANFHDMNSSVQVNNSVQPWDGRAERAATAVASNNPPALIMTQRVETYQFAHENLIIPIDDYVQASGIDPDAIFLFRGNQQPTLARAVVFVPVADRRRKHGPILLQQDCAGGSRP